MSPPPFCAAPARRAAILVGLALLGFVSQALAIAPDAHPASNPSYQNSPASTNSPTPDNPAPSEDAAASGANNLDAASVPSDTDSYLGGSGVQGLNGQRALAPDAFGENQTGIPYSSILNPSAADLHSVDPLFEGSPIHSNIYDPAKVGNVEGSFSIQSGNGGLSIPIVHPGAAPEDADIKAGPFYIKFHSLDGLVLYDDNFNASEYDRRSETLILLRLNLSIIAQISDNIQFAVAGSLGYLPLQNQFGIITSDYNSLGFLLYAVPIFAAQAAYDTIIAGWPVRFADDFRVSTGYYSDDTNSNFDLFNGDYLQRDNNGRYTFRSGNSNLRDDNIDSNSLNQSIIYFSNEISALTDRLMPGDVRLTMKVSHEDLWYNQDSRGLPNSRDDFYASAVSERDNERFKPYVTYEATYVEGLTGLTQSVIAGVFGPIDDQLFLQAQAGFFFDDNGHQGALYLLTIQHDAGPYTTESLTVDRDLTSFDQEVRTSEYYRLTQVLGPTLNLTMFIAHSQFQELVDYGTPNRTEDLGGLRLSWILGPKTTLNLAGIYERQHYDDGFRTESFTGLAILDRIITDTLTMQVLYEYDHVVGNERGQSFYQNLVYLRLIKYFY